MNELLRKLRVRLENVVTRAVLDRGDSNGRYLQLLWGGDRVSADVEHLEPQGLHFFAPADASAVILAPGGSRAGVVALGCGGAIPPEDLSPGEGGLHYLGVYKVFLEADGSLSLGEKEPDARVAVDTLVEARLGELRSAISSALTNVGASTAANGPAAAAQFDIDTAGFPDAVGSSVVKVKS